MNAECMGALVPANGYYVTELPEPPTVRDPRIAPTDVQWVNTLIDTTGDLTKTIVETASAKAQQERLQEFELAKMRLTLPTQEQVQQAMPWVLVGVPAAVVLVMLLRRKRGRR